MRAVLLALALSLFAALAAAQGNLLELLPPVPNAANPVASSAVGGARPRPQLQPGTTVVGVSKSILNGPVALAVVETKDDMQRVSVKFHKVLASAERESMLLAALAVQRDLPLACLKMCKPGRMAAPTISKENKLEFDMVVMGFKRPITVPDMIALLSAKPLAKIDPTPPATPAAPAAPLASASAPQ